MAFSRMTARDYKRATELGFVFVGASKVLLITLVVIDDDIYTLWMEEKTNVEQIKTHLETIKKTETVTKEVGFQELLI